MRRLIVFMICVFAVGSTAANVSAADAPLPALPEAKQIPEASDMQDLSTLPDANSLDMPQAAGPRAVLRRGCIFFPGASITYRFRAAFGANFYRVVPSRFFDVVMRINLQGFRPVRVDRFFAGGIERFNFISPTFARPVAVTISGFRGSTGCFAFFALP